GQPAQLAPGGDLTGEHLGYLIQVQGLDGVVRMDYYRDAVQTYDLFRIGAEHVPGGEVAGFGLADGAGGGTYLRRSVLQSLERGARAVGVDAHFNAMAINADSGDPVSPGGLVEVCPDIAGAVGEQHALHQPRCELGAYGVGAIDLQVQIGCLSRCAQNDKTGQ